ncbi:MAG: hypothetical protein OXC39_07320 [Candidatus Dadabacteria bacterium]|nr:hypothetical protein [Candidatus Dadabacteria bacterium]
MRMLLVFVALFAVTGVVYAETRTECSDRALLIFQECLEFEEEMKAFNKDDSDLYSSWEMRSIGKQAETCVRFYKNEPRYEACRLRAISEFIGEGGVDEAWERLPAGDRETLEKGGITKEKLKEAFEGVLDEYRKK